MKPELIVRIILESPPSGVDFGLQKGKGSDYETIQKQQSNGANLQFDFNIDIKTNGGQQIVFRGPYVQGPPSGQFIYIGIGTYAGQKDSLWGRRLKIPLVGITTEMTAQLIADPQLRLEASVPGTGKDGGPNCATVKPFSGWILKRSAKNI